MRSDAGSAGGNKDEGNKDDGNEDGGNGDAGDAGDRAGKPVALSSATALSSSAASSSRTCANAGRCSACGCSKATTNATKASGVGAPPAGRGVGGAPASTRAARMSG